MSMSKKISVQTIKSNFNKSVFCGFSTLYPYQICFPVQQFASSNRNHLRRSGSDTATLLACLPPAVRGQVSWSQVMTVLVDPSRCPPGEPGNLSHQTGNSENHWYGICNSSQEVTGYPNWKNQIIRRQSSITSGRFPTVRHLRVSGGSKQSRRLKIPTTSIFFWKFPLQSFHTKFPWVFWEKKTSPKSLW